MTNADRYAAHLETCAKCRAVRTDPKKERCETGLRLFVLSLEERTFREDPQ